MAFAQRAKRSYTDPVRLYFLPLILMGSMAIPVAIYFGWKGGVDQVLNAVRLMLCAIGVGALCNLLYSFRRGTTVLRFVVPGLVNVILALALWGFETTSLILFEGFAAGNLFGGLLSLVTFRRASKTSAVSQT